MDINDLRSLFTVLAFLLFIGIVLWAYSAKRKTSFDEAANLAVDDDDALPHASGSAQHHNERNSS
jgi:cytochrome c oxidase cbb3-type subunit IV